jgi:hypothetical protein
MNDPEADLERELARARARHDAVRSELDAISGGGAYLVVDRFEGTLTLKMQGTALFSSPVRFTHPDRTRRVCPDATLGSTPQSQNPPPGRYRIGVRCADGTEFALGLSTKDHGLLGWIANGVTGVLGSGPEGGTLEVPAPEALRLYSNLNAGMRVIFVEGAPG